MKFKTLNVSVAEHSLPVPTISNKLLSANKQTTFNQKETPGVDQTPRVNVEEARIATRHSYINNIAMWHCQAVFYLSTIQSIADFVSESQIFWTSYFHDENNHNFLGIFVKRNCHPNIFGTSGIILKLPTELFYGGPSPPIHEMR